jgi:hypothetical protein
MGSSLYRRSSSSINLPAGGSESTSKRELDRVIPGGGVLVSGSSDILLFDAGWVVTGTRLKNERMTSSFFDLFDQKSHGRIGQRRDIRYSLRSAFSHGTIDDDDEMMRDNMLLPLHHRDVLVAFHSIHLSF